MGQEESRGAAPRAGSALLCVPGVPVALPGVWGAGVQVQVQDWGVPRGMAGGAGASCAGALPGVQGMHLPGVGDQHGGDGGGGAGC